MNREERERTKGKWRRPKRRKPKPGEKWVYSAYESCTIPADFDLLPRHHIRDDWFTVSVPNTTGSSGSLSTAMWLDAQGYALPHWTLVTE